MAQIGSEMGNFIYVDTNKNDYLQKINEAMGVSMQMAVEKDRTKMHLKNAHTGY